MTISVDVIVLSGLVLHVWHLTDALIQSISIIQRLLITIHVNRNSVGLSCLKDERIRSQCSADKDNKTWGEDGETRRKPFDPECGQ